MNRTKSRRAERGLKRERAEHSGLPAEDSECELPCGAQCGNAEERKDKLYVVQEHDTLRIISKQSMDDTDLLVSIHNSLVVLPYP